MRLALLSTLLLALAGCAATPPLEAEPASDGIPPHLLGTWTYTAEQADQVVTGRYTLTPDPAGHRMEAPGLLSDEVQNSVLVIEDGQVAWSGVMRTMGGPAGFRITGVLDGDTVRGTNEIDGLGTFTFVSTKQ